MALGDSGANSFSDSTRDDSNHLDDYLTSSNDAVEAEFRNRLAPTSAEETATTTSTRRNDNATATTVITTINGDTSDVYGYGMSSMVYLPQTIVLCELRHEGFEVSIPTGPADNGLVSKWRPKERMKTGMVALVLCLNISCDPPDVIKISPCARLESWIDPFAMPPPKALEAIGKTLSVQYERWQPKARYKHILDPTVEDVKKLCNASRRFAKTERVLFHYNGHGVPKPTANGEIWLFNKSYTQYIPLPITELDSWLKSPSIYVFDCSAAGNIVNAFIELIDASASSGAVKDCILLAACEPHETLPQSADFPADVFTSCLTTPIQMALRWFCKRSLLRDSFDYSLIDRIPGRPNDRKTLLGELNWIFTAVTDTIAWNVLPHELFQKLCRQDLLVASLLRNFLLAERIMRSANCSPISYPMLPPTHQHHMWDVWDMAAEICLSQLPSLIHDETAEFQPSPFFTEQLTAFEVWLDHGSEQKKRPEQLPIVLQLFAPQEYLYHELLFKLDTRAVHVVAQYFLELFIFSEVITVLLSQCHRYRALMLLGKFLDMGPWAVEQALSVGIFPYVLKLLQTITPELRKILVFIWTKILALDKSCQVDLVKDGGHTYFIRFLDSSEGEAFPEQRAMAAFVLAVIVDGHKRGQEACIEAGLLDVCLKHLQASTPDDAQTEPLFLQWLCLCLGKLWENFTEAQLIGLLADAVTIISYLLSESQPEVRASAVFALGTLLNIGESSGDGRDIEFDDDEKLKAEISIIKSLLTVVSDGSPLVRAEVAVALARFSFCHSKHLKSAAATSCRFQPTSGLSTLPVNNTGSGYNTPNHYLSSGNIVTSQIGPLFRISGDSTPIVRDGRASTSSPLATAGITHGSPLSDGASQHSDSGASIDVVGTGILNHARPRALDNALYSECIYAMCTLANDPSPRISRLGRRVLSMIAIEQVIARSLRHSSSTVRTSEPAASASARFAGLARSSSWFDMSSGHLPLTFRTPPVSPPRTTYMTGIRRVSSMEIGPNLLNSPDSGLADPLLGYGGSSIPPERSLLPPSTIYKWSCGHFTKPLLTASDDNEELIIRREEKERSALDLIAKSQHCSVSKLSNQIASWDTKFEMGTKATLLQPFSPVVIAADKNGRIRVWNYEEPTLLNSFDNQEFPDKGIPKLCLLNELDDSLLLVASGDGNVRIWKDYMQRGQQKLVTAFSSIPIEEPSSQNVNAVVDWQQQSGYLFASGDISGEDIPSIKVWDLDREQLLHSISSSCDSSTSAIAASHVHASQFAAGFVDGSVRLFDIRTPDMLVCATRPHVQKVERVVGIGFQPGLDPAKVISASQAGDIQFLDLRNLSGKYLSIDAHRGSLTALAVHRHAPIIASGSAKQFIKVFNLKGDPLGIIRYYHPTFMAQKIGPVSCLAFHPYEVLLAAGAADPFVTLFADDSNPAR